MILCDFYLQSWRMAGFEDRKFDRKRRNEQSLASWLSFPEERLRRFKDRNFDWNDESTTLDQILMKLDGIKMGRSRISVVSIFATKKRMFGRGGCRRNELPLIVASWCRWWCSMRVESLGDFSVAEKGAKESNGFLVRGAWWLSSSVTGFRLFRARLVEAVWQGEKD